MVISDINRPTDREQQIADQCFYRKIDAPFLTCVIEGGCGSHGKKLVDPSMKDTLETILINHYNSYQFIALHLSFHFSSWDLWIGTSLRNPVKSAQNVFISQV